MNKAYLLLVAVLPALISVFIYDQINGNDSISIQSNGIGNGHVEVTVRDSGGEVTGYKQSDNAILNTGENCWVKMLFRDPTDAGNVVCTGATNESWNYLCLGENAAIGFDSKELSNPADEAGLATCQKANITWNQNSTGTTSALSKVTLRLSSTFTNAGASETINIVGVANATSISTRSLLSMANFTDQVVTNGGTITVNYDYEWGGGTVP